MEKIVEIIRHAKSAKEFLNSNLLTSWQFELEKPIVPGAQESATELGQEIFTNYRDFLCGHNNVLLIHSGRKRSYQTLACITYGIFRNYKAIQYFIDDSINIHKGLKYCTDFDLGYIMDKRYSDAAKKAVKQEIYQNTIDFYFDTPPEKFIQQTGTELSRTMTAEEMQNNFKNVIRRTVDQVEFEHKSYAFVVGHEPVISLGLVGLTDQLIDELGGKSKELERIKFLSEWSKGSLYPDIGLVYKGKEFDIGSKVYS